MGKQEVREKPLVFQTSGTMWPQGAPSSNHGLRGRARHPQQEVPWISFQVSRKPQKGKGREGRGKNPWMTDTGVPMNLDKGFSELVMDQSFSDLALLTFQVR